MGSSSAYLAICVAALERGGGGLLASLIVISSLCQFVLAAKLSLFRRIFTPTVAGTVSGVLPRCVERAARERHDRRRHNRDRPDAVRGADRAAPAAPEDGADPGEPLEGRRIPVRFRLAREAYAGNVGSASRRRRRDAGHPDPTAGGRRPTAGRHLLLSRATTATPSISSSRRRPTTPTWRIGWPCSASRSPAPRVEEEVSLRLLRHYASSVRHQQFHDTDVVTVRVGPAASM